MKSIMKQIYRMFAELAEGWAPKSHYHVSHQLAPVKVEARPYHQKYHS